MWWCSVWWTNLSARARESYLVSFTVSSRFLSNEMSPEMAINITRLSIAFSFCWPVPASSSRAQVLFMKIVLAVTTVSGFTLVSLLMYGAYVHFGDPILTSKCVCLTICVSQFVMQTIICLVKYETLQVSFSLRDYVQQFPIVFGTCRNFSRIYHSICYTWVFIEIWLGLYYDTWLSWLLVQFYAFTYLKKLLFLFEKFPYINIP